MEREITKAEWHSAIDLPSSLCKEQIAVGNQYAAGSFAEEAAFYAFKAYPELRVVVEIDARARAEKARVK